MDTILGHTQGRLKESVLKYIRTVDSQTKSGVAFSRDSVGITITPEESPQYSFP